jgi:hypothetical protein
MLTDRKGEIRTEEVYEEVSSIDGPGKYRFARDLNRKPGYLETEVDIDIHGEYTPHFEQDIPDHLVKKFPNIWDVVFLPATLLDGKFTPAGLKFFPKWEAWGHRQPAFIGFGGEIYKISHGGNSSNGYGSWWLGIEDIGNLSVVENKLEIAQPENRDGKLSIHLSGTISHFRREPGKHWQGWVNVEGDRPGILVKSVIEYLNDAKTASSIPLWKATQTPV